MLVEFFRWLGSLFGKLFSGAEFREDFRLLKEAYREAMEQNQLLAVQLQQRIEVLETRLAEAESELDKERQRLQQQLRTNAKLEKQLEQTQSELAALKRQVADMDQRRTDHGGQI